MEQATPSVWDLAADLFDPPRTGAVVYRDDPVGFVRDCFKWTQDDDGPTFYQEGILGRLVEKKRLAVRGPHGLGKTAEASWIVLWFGLTRDMGGEDWKCVTTASAWRQLEKYLWPEIHKWAKKLDWERIGRPPFRPTELMRLDLKLTHGQAFAAACEDPAKIEGCHADQVLFLYDEAKTIPEATFDASEGAFSGAGADTRHEAYAIASSTPGAPMGRFYDMHKKRPGLEDWHTVHVTIDDTIKAGRNSRDWVNRRRKQWGATSAAFITRVLGEFAESESDGVIPLAWVEAALDRWYSLPRDDDGKLIPPDLDVDPLTVGADIARSGDDRTVLALRYGYAIREVRSYGAQGTMETAGRIQGILEAHHHPARQSTAVVDVIGIGAGVVDRLRETSPERIMPFHASEASLRRDRSGELGFVNCRAAAWWNLREMLDPDSGIEIVLPNDQDQMIGDIDLPSIIIGDLTAPRWKVMSGGKIQLESKDDLRKRINRSTDVGDAIVQAFWTASGVVSAMSHFAENADFGFFAATPGRSRWAI